MRERVCRQRSVVDIFLEDRSRGKFWRDSDEEGGLHNSLSCPGKLSFNFRDLRLDFAGDDAGVGRCLRDREASEDEDDSLCVVVVAAFLIIVSVVVFVVWKSITCMGMEEGRRGPKNEETTWLKIDPLSAQEGKGERRCRSKKKEEERHVVVVLTVHTTTSMYERCLPLSFPYHLSEGGCEGWRRLQPQQRERTLGNPLRVCVVCV